ncbi:MAG: hypothetical protein ACXV4D_07160 [Ilumatobacteraceae bacterium]
MTRQRLNLAEDDLTVLARALNTDADSLRGELERRPWYANDVLRRPEVVEAVLHGAGAEHLTVSPLLFFAVLIHHAADELSGSDWVNEWTGPGCRLPVFDVEPLLEFADEPARLLFTARLLAGFAVPEAAPVPADRLDLDELVDWLGAVGPADHIVLLRQLGDLALFQAGVFPDSIGATALSTSQAEHLGRSVRMTDAELDHLTDHGSPTPGLDALETLSSAWYRAAAEGSPTAPVLLRDVAHRIRAARRFLNYAADRYLHRAQSRWAPGL